MPTNRVDVYPEGMQRPVCASCRIGECPQQEILDLDPAAATSSCTASGLPEQHAQVSPVGLPPEQLRTGRDPLHVRAGSLQGRSLCLEQYGGVQVGCAQDGEKDVLPAHVAGAKSSRFFACVLKEAPDIRCCQERRLADREIAEAAMGGLTRDPEIARDRRERRALGQRMRHLPALERVELVPEFGEKTQRRSRGRSARGLSRKSGESVTRGQSTRTRPAKCGLCLVRGIDILSARNLSLVETPKLPRRNSKKENAAEGRRSASHAEVNMC
jgi:hypothetical protein